MNDVKRPSFWLLFVVLAMSCVEPYIPPTSTKNPYYLVIDASLNNKGSAYVILTRTIPLTGTSAPDREENAVVTIVDENQNTTLLYHEGNGQYRSDEIPTAAGAKYQLKIETADRRVYESEFVPLKSTPPMDSVYWQVIGEDLEIKVSAHDDSQETIYYKWQTVETFEYTSIYASGMYLLDSIIYERKPEEAIDKCWTTTPSSEIFIYSTERFTEDRVAGFLLKKIRSDEVRLSRKYSLLVQQTSLTEEGYHYWLNIKETTEKLGGLFDPMPGSVIGNIRCLSDPSQPVIGFFTAATVIEKRIFITPSDLPKNFLRYAGPFCEVDTIGIEQLRDFDISGIIAPTYYIDPGTPPILNGYTFSSAFCTDCRVYGDGVTKKPEFWE
jgi:hypothetical protein